MSGSFQNRHHVEPRVKLYSPGEVSFLIPLKYIDVIRTTRTNLDVKQEKRIDDYWNIDGSRDLSDPWTGFTQFTLLKEELPDGYMWSGGRSTRKQLTSRPDHLWPELWMSMGKHAKLKEKQKWSVEKIHLDNARKLRGIYFIDPEEKEFKETIKNARKKLETSVALAMPFQSLRRSIGLSQEKWKMFTNYSKFQNRSVQTFGFVYHDTNGQNHGPVWKTQSVFLSGICTVNFYGKGNRVG